MKELRQLSKKQVEVDKSIWKLRKSYAELAGKIDTVEGEIRLLGGKVPAGQDHAGRAMLGHLRDGWKLSDLRP